MEKLFGQYDVKEFMRMTMLKHEETFKEQVYELHRLYRIQKTLMESIENKRRQLGMEHHADGHHGNEMHEILEVIDESDIELTLGPPTKKRHSISTPTETSDSGLSLSSSSTESCHMKMGYRNGSEINVDVEEQLSEERLRQIPLVFQVLTTNMS